MADSTRDREVDSTSGSGRGQRRVPWVVDADWLAAHAGDDDVAVVDVRDAWEYDGIGHVPGAVSVPFDSFRSDGDEDVGMLPGADAWAEVMRDAGVERDDVLVAYDDTHGVFAARFLVTALMYGHRDVALLDGDYAAYSRQHPTTNDAPEVERGSYEATVPDGRPLIGADAVAALLDGGIDHDHGDDVVFLDTRDDWEYDDGHLPGAVNLDWKALVDEETRGLLPDDELREVLAATASRPRSASSSTATPRAASATHMSSSGTSATTPSTSSRGRSPSGASATARSRLTTDREPVGRSEGRR
jgi:thiosulfate/3-mercaptopyruvate sulfurtransferase